MSKSIQEFILSALRIDPRCRKELRKVLKEEYYFFNDRCKTDSKGNVVLNSDYHQEYSIYGPRLSINTIVGKNGSGKSSLLEMMYRIINNFSSLLVRDTKRASAYPLYFIEGLWADLYYVIDNGEDGERLACLLCQGDDVILLVDGKSVFNLHLKGGSKKLTQETIAKYWDSLFYTIVTNYSVHSFISSDFKEEGTYRVETKGEYQLMKDAQWMSSLFHKNDGYLTPIVLNPYRDAKGNMNMDVERKLTISRLTSILIFFKEHKAEFLEGYRLHDIRYRYDFTIVEEKYIGDMKDDLIISESIRKRVWDFSKAAQKSGTYANEILNRFGFKGLDYSNGLVETAAAYLVYKVLSVAKSYPTYSIYQISGGPNLFDERVDSKDIINLVVLVDEIIKDKSHITLKIRQTRRFLQQYRPGKGYDLMSPFSFSDYQQSLGDTINAGGLAAIMEQIPPSFFVPTIYLDKVEDGNVIEIAVPLTRMSSGERQYLYNFSTIIYHMRNLLSIQDSNRVRYRSIHLVFDEVEICFHPEYQRRFINSLISVLNRTRISSHCAIQITIATHSPFILSDVSPNNILYLEDGRNVGGSITVNPFGANINDVLQQNFFLNNGFIGEFAQKKINSLVDYLSKDVHKEEWTDDSAKHFIDNVVGEPIIKRLLMELLIEKQRSNAQNINYR